MASGIGLQMLGPDFFHGRNINSCQDEQMNQCARGLCCKIMVLDHGVTQRQPVNARTCGVMVSLKDSR